MQRFGLRHSMRVRYFSSQRMHCPNCTRCQHGEQTTYSHSQIAPVLAAPDSPHVFSLEPEFIQPQAVYDKQDCEQQAIKCWLARNHRNIVSQCNDVRSVTFLMR